METLAMRQKWAVVHEAHVQRPHDMPAWAQRILLMSCWADVRELLYIGHTPRAHTSPVVRTTPGSESWGIVSAFAPRYFVIKI
jgi:hypothetical protein